MAGEKSLPEVEMASIYNVAVMANHELAIKMKLLWSELIILQCYRL